MALTSVRSNKMRSLLTMLGIIIGIAAVIAIETVGNSMTGSVMDSMSGMGASNISVTVTQKSSSDTSGTSQGVRLRRFMDSKPSDADLITDAMINDFTAAFPTQVHHIELTQQVGSGTTAKYGDPTTTITATVSGINHAHWQPGTMIRRFCTDAGWTTTGTPGARSSACRKSSSSRPSAAVRRTPSARRSR